MPLHVFARLCPALCFAAPLIAPPLLVRASAQTPPIAGAPNPNEQVQPPLQSAPVQSAPVQSAPVQSAPVQPPLQSAPSPGAAQQPPDVQSGEEEPGGNYSLIPSGNVIYDMKRGLAVAQGGVTFTYREFSVRGQTGVIDYNNNKATITGNLTVTVRDQVLTGKTLVFDLDTGRWVLSQIRTTFPPEFFPPGTVLQPIYVSGGQVTGNDDRSNPDRITGNNFKFTSCDRDDYYIESKRLDFYRDPKTGEPDRIALRKNSLYVLGRKILPLPVYVIALAGARSRRIGLQPTFGQNSIDGVFAKTVYDLSANQKRTDSLLIDLLQKRGLGLGFQRELAGSAGLFYLYALSNKTGGRQIDARVRRDFQITPNLRSTFNFNSTKDNSFGGPGTGAQNADLSFSLNKARINSNLFLRYSNTTGAGDFNSLSATLDHRQQFGRGLQFEGGTLFNRSRSSGLDASSTLDNTFTFSRRARLIDAFLRTELHDDLSGANQINGAYQLERLPELALQTDPKRLGLPFFARYLPGNIDLSVGLFNEPFSRQRLTRTGFNYAARPEPFQLFRAGSFSSVLNAAGSFQQTFYSNDTARYAYDYTFDLNNSFGPLSAQINYSKQRNLGFTPFQFDFLTPGENIDATLSLNLGPVVEPKESTSNDYNSLSGNFGNGGFGGGDFGNSGFGNTGFAGGGLLGGGFGNQPNRALRLNLSTGRDIENGISRDIVGSVQFAPSPSFYATLGTNYSVETKEFGDIIGNLRVARNPGKFLGGDISLGLRYSPRDRTTSLNLAADVRLTRKTRLEVLSSYNGFSRSFDFNQFRVTQDLHCFNLYATFDQQRKELRFDLAIKAFPFLDTRFGLNRAGEGFDPFIGSVQ